MKTLKEAKIDAVRTWLRNHVEPQKRFDGMSSYAMAVSLVEALEEQELMEEERWNELQVIRQYQDAG